MVNKINIVVHITIMIFLSQTFAQLFEDWKLIPQPVTLKSCANWILSTGFQGFCTDINRKLAKERDRRFDGVVPVWAVMYAQILIAFPKLGKDVEYTPHKYCDDQGMENDLLPFKTFKNFQKTCEEWIQLYNYRTDEHKGNWDIAQTREIAEDGAISLWAAGYARFISSFDKSVTISISYYCSKMVEKGKSMLFMSLDETKMSCKEWIELSGYTNNFKTNLKKVRKSNPIIELFLNTWTQLYADYLRNPDHRTINIPCCGLSRSKRLKPIEFCHLIVKKPVEIQVKYFEEKKIGE